MSSAILDKLAKVVIDGDEEGAKRAAQEVIDAKMNPVDAIKLGLAKGMAAVGKKFHDFEVFLPEVILAADAMKAGINVLRPHMSAESLAQSSKGKVVIATVFGDIHDIGKNLVGVMLEAAGYEVHDLGCDVAPTKFVDKAKEVSANIIAMSSLMVTSMYYQKDVLDYLKDAGTRGKYFIMVGGGPVTPEWTKDIGADGYGKFADDAVTVANILMEKGEEIARPVIKE